MRAKSFWSPRVIFRVMQRKTHWWDGKFSSKLLIWDVNTICATPTGFARRGTPIVIWKLYICKCLYQLEIQFAVCLRKLHVWRRRWMIPDVTLVQWQIATQIFCKLSTCIYFCNFTRNWQRFAFRFTRRAQSNSLKNRKGLGG